MSWENKYNEAISVSDKTNDFNKKLKQMYRILKLRENGGLEIEKELSDNFITYANHYINFYKNKELSSSYALEGLYKEFERRLGQN